MIYEERHIRVQPGAFDEYRRWAHSQMWPNLVAAGHVPLCLLSGLIGLSAQDVVLFTGFSGYEAWQAAQPLIAGDGPATAPRAWIERETARLLLPSETRPDLPVAPSKRRAVYGLRRWWIDPENWPEYNRLSVEGVWPALDHMGHYSLGQFRHAATTSPLEIVNIAGYDDPAMWQATRDPATAGVPDDLVAKFRTAIRTRRAMVRESYVCLMAAHWPDIA